jgi:hypothetical protein
MTSSTEIDLTSSASSNVCDAYTFYNNSQEHSLDGRNESKIIRMQKFNNWIKSTLINQYLEQIRNEQPERSNEIHVFDMGCGKGGDHRKWNNGNVKFVTFADLTENSVEACNFVINLTQRSHAMILSVVNLLFTIHSINWNQSIDFYVMLLNSYVSVVISFL